MASVLAFVILFSWFGCAVVTFTDGRQNSFMFQALAVLVAIASILLSLIVLT